MHRQTRMAAYIKDPQKIISYYQKLVHCYRLKKQVMQYIKKNRNDAYITKRALADLQVLIQTQLHLIKDRNHEFNKIAYDGASVIHFANTCNDAALHMRIVAFVQDVLQGKKKVLLEETQLVSVLHAQHDRIIEYLDDPTEDKVNNITMIAHDENGVMMDLGLI
jgi:hypothetical protein